MAFSFANQECLSSLLYIPLFECNSCHNLISSYNSTASTNTELPPVWQQIPDDSLPLNERQLQKISEQLTDWKPLARYLGLDEPTIAEIDEDNRTSKERKYQVLYTWSQRKGDNATLKALLQCVEFELGDRELAQRIVYTL